MKNKKILAILTIAASVSMFAAGCNFGGAEPEEQVVVTETPTPAATATPTPEPTIAPDVQDALIHPATEPFPLNFRMRPGRIRQTRQICSALSHRSRARS